MDGMSYGYYKGFKYGKLDGFSMGFNWDQKIELYQALQLEHQLENQLDIMKALKMTSVMLQLMENILEGKVYCIRQ